jgi:hypothetical protein
MDVELGPSPEIRIYAGNSGEQVAEENIWTYDICRNRSIEKMTQRSFEVCNWLRVSGYRFMGGTLRTQL